MWRKVRTSLKPGGYGEIGDTGDYEFWEIGGNHYMWLKGSTSCESRGFGRLEYWGFRNLPEAWKKSLLAEKTENLLEPLEISKESGILLYVAEVRKSVKADTWEADELENWGAPGI